MLTTLGQRTRTLLNAESEFDSRIAQHSIGTLNNQSSSPSDFEEQLTRSGCEIKLDDDNNKLKLTSLLGSFSDVFSETPYRKEIDCNSLTIPFRDENAIVHKPARTLNPSKMEIANKIFDELIEVGYVVESNYKFSSPIVLVIYPDGKEPRLTGDFSGKDGVNAHTISVEPNLPKISDILEFLSRANYIAALDLPKAFWQMNVAEKNIEKTSISIPGRSIMFKRACFGLKNIPAVFQIVMMEIFQIDGVLRVLISTDASDVAVGGVIWQEIEPYSPAGTPLNKMKVKPLSFYSRLLTETQRKWSTLQKELYAILLILTENCLESYLLTRHLTIFTDHKNIAFLTTAPEKNRIVKRWLPILSEFDFDIVHEPGEDNHWADMLSRNIDLDQHEETPSICSINIPDTLLSNYEIPPIDDDSDSDFEVIPSLSSLSKHQDLPIFSFWFSKIRSEQQIAKNNNDPLFENAILDENTQIWKNN
ncbi:hypothetical protein P9112_012411 [Eukaryota sp. TZLM1-RC]